MHALKQHLDQAGIVSKRRLDRFGRHKGGLPIGRGALYLMLQNRLYRGEVVHKDKCFAGEHPAIVDEALWDRVQTQLQANRVDRKRGGAAASPSLLVGLFTTTQASGSPPLTPTKPARAIATISAGA